MLAFKSNTHFIAISIFYIKSNIAKEIINLVTRLAEPKDKGVSQLARQLPVFNNKYPEAGYECTLATAMLRTALELAGFSNTRSLLLRRHFVCMQELEDGSINIFDAATRHTR